MQDDRLDAPTVADHKPARQDTQPSLSPKPDDDSWYLPATHGMQAVAFEAPTADDHDPALHAKQPFNDWPAAE